MCRDKTGCVCHWASDLGPDHSRLRPTLPSTPARNLHPTRDAQRTPRPIAQVVLGQRPLGPPQTPLPIRPAGLRQPLQTPPNFNLPTRTQASSSKRKRQSRPTQPNKRQNTGLVFGVGPPDTPANGDTSAATYGAGGNSPTRRTSSTLPRPKAPPANSRADIWAFMRPIQEDQGEHYRDNRNPLINLPRLTSRPRSDLVGCILCEYVHIYSIVSRMLIFRRDEGKRKLWSNGNNPQTTTIAKHLTTHPTWAEKCTKAGIASKQAPTPTHFDSVQDEPFTADRLVQYLTRWIAVDDQVC
jgi:hypothetical protein